MIDLSEINQLEADLRAAGGRAALGARSVLAETGDDIRDDARRFAPGAHGGVAKHYPASITSEVLPGGLSAEIGPEKGGQGSLGHLFEYGVESRGQAPLAHLGPALDRHEPEFVSRMAELGAREMLP